MEDEEMRENSESDLSKVPKNLQPHVFKKGQIANPLGRKKGSVSLKQYAKQMLESMTYEERMEYLEGLPKDFIWQMAEGKPQTNTDITSGGQPIQFVAPEVVANRINESSTNTTS